MEKGFFWGEASKWSLQERLWKMSAAAGMGKNLMSKQGSSQMEKGRMLQPEARNNKARKDNHPSGNACAEQGRRFSYGPASNTLKWTGSSCSLQTKFVRKKGCERILFCLKVHWKELGEGQGEQSACKERDQGSICAAYEKKDRNQERKCLKIASLCVIMGELEESVSCKCVHQGDLELKLTCGQFKVLLELVKGLPC